MEKYGRGGKATDGNIIGCMRFACRITKATGTQSHYLTRNAFNDNNGCANAARRCVHTYIISLVEIPVI